MQDKIIVKGAREHNLKNVSLEMPRNSLTVFTGISGSGKSTLAFDTIYAEGQRRYVESLSSYARQFLGIMSKPDVDSIDGLSPAISIEQKGGSKNPRSTVGTTTEIYDYLRLLFARVGTPFCPKCGTQITSQSIDAIVDAIMERGEGREVTVFAPIAKNQKGAYEKIIEDLGRAGFNRIRIDGEYFIIDRFPGNLDKQKKHDIDLVVDRIRLSGGERGRLAEAVQVASGRGEGLVLVAVEKNETLYSQKNACSKCGFSFGDIEPSLFSFNSPVGACVECHGLGIKMKMDPDLVIPDRSKSIFDGAIASNSTAQGMMMTYLSAVAKAQGFKITDPVGKLSKKQLDAILYGTDDEIDFDYESKSGEFRMKGKRKFEGVIPQLERLYMQTESDWRREEMQQFMREIPCPECNGNRLKPEALAVRIDGKNIIEVTKLSISSGYGFFQNLKLRQQEQYIARPVLKEIRSRLDFMINVGLDYLTLDRATGTLSGGEAQRIRLATQIGANLTGVLYVLDEPSIGLHQRDNAKLLSTLKSLRDLGNTLIVVEHDEETMRAADYIVDIGPGAGKAGGEIVVAGTLSEILSTKKSITGAYLRGEKKIPAPPSRRKPRGWLELKACSHNNLRGINAKFPLGVICCITGVSGSGKSSLINETLYPALHNRTMGAKETAGSFYEMVGAENIDSVVEISQAPIGRTPRSNPATYIGAFTPIRELFSKLPDARGRGWTPGRFSFNVPGGRCMHCEGDGLIRIEMHFLPDVYVRCQECGGKRYDKETLSVRYRGKSIADVLSMTVDEAGVFFANIPAVAHKLGTLVDVGLGYVQLGQSATTLSGGEAQRVKLAAELSRRDSGKTVYILDEPTTGLHFADVSRLLDVLQRLVGQGNTVIVIEHNLDVIKTADWIIDLGPEGGDEGGKVVASGTPEDVAANRNSYTGEYLRGALGKK